MKFAKNGKIFGKISIIDILVVIVAVLMIKVVYDKYNYSVNGPSTQTVIKQEFEYIAKIKGISSTTIDMLKINDEVYDKTSSTMIGKITEIKHENAKYEFEGNDGKIYIKEYPGKVDVTLTIKTDGTIKEGEYLANNLIRVLIGENKVIKTKYVQVEANIIDIKMGE